MELYTRCTIACIIWFIVAGLPIAFATRSCSARPETGPCLHHLERWAYDPKIMTCVPFTYGGCGGNNNKFVSLVECLRVCKSGRIFAARSRRKWHFAREQESAGEKPGSITKKKK